MVAVQTPANYVAYETIRIINDAQPEPIYHCASCGRCQNKHCTFFNRYVEPRYNRCFAHSHYNKQIGATYKSPDEEFFRRLEKEEIRKIKELQNQVRSLFKK